MSFQLINRRVHLYLGMFLLPWVLMYALSSLVFSHLQAISAWDGRGRTIFEIEWEKDLDLPVPENADLREFGPKILKEVGLETPFFASRRGNQITFLLIDFWKRGRLVYDLEQKKAVLRSFEPRWYQMLTGLHLRAGYRHDDFWSDVWAFVLDLVCVGFLVWIASGLYMWWKIQHLRFWGFATLAGGAISFFLFMVGL